MDVYQFANLINSLQPAVEKESFNEAKDLVAEEVRDIQAENFASEADAKGTSWPPRKRKYPHPPLRKTLRMFNAATQKGSPGAVERRDAEGLTMAIEDQAVPYAKWQQRGTADGRLPARQYYYLKRVHLPRLAKKIYPTLHLIFKAQAQRAAGI